MQVKFKSHLENVIRKILDLIKLSQSDEFLFRWRLFIQIFVLPYFFSFFLTWYVSSVRTIQAFLFPCCGFSYYLPVAILIFFFLFLVRLFLGFQVISKKGRVLHLSILGYILFLLAFFLFAQYFSKPLCFEGPNLKRYSVILPLMACSQGFLYIGSAYLLAEYFLLSVSFFPSLTVLFIFFSPFTYTGYDSIYFSLKFVLKFLMKSISFSSGLALCMAPENLPESSGEKVPKTFVQRGAELLGGYEVTSQERGVPCDEDKLTLSLQRHEDGSCTLRAVQCLDDPRIPEAVSTRTHSFLSENVPSMVKEVAEDATRPVVVAAETGTKTEVTFSSHNCEKVLEHFHKALTDCKKSGES